MNAHYPLNSHSDKRGLFSITWMNCASSQKRRRGRAFMRLQMKSWKCLEMSIFELQHIRLILRIDVDPAFPDCVGSWECQHWAWKNCPVTRAERFKSKEKKNKIASKAIAGAKMWIWGCRFGKPSSMNDINVLDCSPLVSGIFNETLLPPFEYEVNRKEWNCLYFLVGGIHAQWSVLVSAIAEETTRN